MHLLKVPLKGEFAWGHRVTHWLVKLIAEVDKVDSPSSIREPDFYLGYDSVTSSLLQRDP